MKRRIKWKNVILAFLFLVFLIIFIISIIKIIKWVSDNKRTSNQIKEINKITDIIVIEDNEKTEVIEQTDIKKEDPYYDFIKMNLIDVDFSELKKKNKETVGWIQVEGTNINYPFVQTSNNDFYLNHSFNKKVNGAGWVFLDYRNNIKDIDQNPIIYAHGRLDKTMFGTLRTILKSSWLENDKNHVIKLSTESENTLWQVFSVYKIPNTDDYLNINFSSEDFKSFGDKLIKRSAYDFKTTLNENDKILTLSTCWDDNTKVVLHAKLIKKEKK